MGKADFTVPLEVVFVQYDITCLTYVIKLILWENLASKINSMGFDSIYNRFYGHLYSILYDNFACKIEVKYTKEYFYHSGVVLRLHPSKYYHHSNYFIVDIVWFPVLLHQQPMPVSDIDSIIP